MNQGAGSPGVRRAVVMPADDSTFRGLHGCARGVPAGRIPPPVAGGGKGEGFARGRALENRLAERTAGVIRAYRRETPPPAPAHKGRGNAVTVKPKTCGSIYP